ncbi:E3 ubiquitin-protein ligase LRSAM1-like isoform X2 [Babylonia areolata]|uniref:E3 ubiquitin-protein ligase LRSAM1-like isoform X2 n=1 Tax=Babylonia areolata TaxID=304850 RepID=UPI003FD2D403
MPLFRRQSEKGRKRQQRQELLAQQDPEPKFDLSDCELQEVPSGVFAICKVLQKEALFLNKNWLSALGGGNFSDLRTLRILDVHSNELKALPDDLGCLDRLQILNLEDNKLKKLPDSIGYLRSLQTLNVKSNKLRDLPESLCDLPALRLLDISDNDISELPQRLACVRTLETLKLDSAKFKYPADSICKQGTEAIMKFLCQENNFEYEPPSKFLLNALEPPKGGISCSQSENSIKTFQDEARLLESVEQYQKLMQQKRKEARALEQQMAEERRLQAQLAASAASNKRQLLDTITQDQERMDQHLSELSSQKEGERKRFLQTLHSVEERASDLLAELLDVNEKAKKTEAILDELEKERMKENDWFSVRWEELMNLRKQEVLEGMNYMLEEFRKFEEQRQLTVSEREMRGQRALELEEEISSGQVESLLHHRDTQHNVLLDTLAEQEALQKQAVEALMMARDAKHSRISSQVALIESELAQLTVVEVGKRALRMENEMSVLAEKRIALSGMLAQLLDEQQKRQKELQRRMVEMEQQREDGQTDYWLVQYQRLLDRKPQALIDKESQLEIAVKKILIHAGAEEYVPVFARHRITIETMMQLDDSDLKQMGVHELGLRKAILNGIELQRGESSKLTQKEKEISLLPQLEPLELPPAEGPSAPPSYEAAMAASSTAGAVSRQDSVTARGINSECVVCLDRTSEVIFLPCGHVCTCPVCTAPLTECPMCRAPISQRIKLSVPVPV